MQKSQEELILEHLQNGHSITPLEALSMFQCFRLSGRIYDLIHKGYNIKSEPFKTPSGKWVSKYFLIDEPIADTHSAMVAENNLHAEEKLNYKAVGAQLEFV